MNMYATCRNRGSLLVSPRRAGIVAVVAITLATLMVVAEAGYVGQSIRARLSLPDVSGEQGRTWDFTDSALMQEEDWMMLTPMNQLGKRAASLVVAKSCT